MPNKKRLCECGCGNPAPTVTKTSSAQSRVKGEASRFILGHARRRPRASLYTVDEQSGCWNWNGPLTKDGYASGSLSAGARTRSGVAHRVFYEEAKGPIPNGLVLDHRCRNRRCVNPEHLEPVTQKENVRRSWSTCWTWKESYGPIPEGLRGEHHCKNPHCVNPAHLQES